MAEILATNGTIDMGLWSGNHTNVRLIASTQDDADNANCTRLQLNTSAPQIAKFDLASTTYANVNSITVRARLRYDAGATVTISVRDSGGSEILSTTVGVTGAYQDFSATLTGNWTQTQVNGFQLWVSFDAGDTPGVNLLRLPAAELEVEPLPIDGDGPAQIVRRFINTVDREILRGVGRGVHRGVY